MKTPFWGASIAAASILMSHAHASPPPSSRRVRAEIATSLSRVNAALMRRDAGQFKQAFLSSVTPDFALHQPDGRKQTRDDILKATLDRMPDIVAVPRIRTRIERVAVQGNKAVVVVSFYAHCTLKDSRTGVHQDEAWARTRDLWVHTPGGWKRKRGDLLSSRERVGGKPKKSGRERSPHPQENSPEKPTVHGTERT